MTASLLTYSIDFITQKIHMIIASIIFICLGIIQYYTQKYLDYIQELKRLKQIIVNERENSDYQLNLEKELHKETKKNTYKTIQEIKERLEK